MVGLFDRSTAELEVTRKGNYSRIVAKIGSFTIDESVGARKLGLPNLRIKGDCSRWVMPVETNDGSVVLRLDFFQKKPSRSVSIFVRASQNSPYQLIV